jgi:hypothetical protein
MNERTVLTPTGNPEVDIYHAIKLHEKWHGLILSIPSAPKRKDIKLVIDQILEENGHDPSGISENRLYFAGNYKPPVLAELKEIVAQHMPEYDSPPIPLKGSYFDFLGGNIWVKRYFDKYP